jgi:hypothetical protein
MAAATGWNNANLPSDIAASGAMTLYAGSDSHVFPVTYKLMDVSQMLTEISEAVGTRKAITNGKVAAIGGRLCGLPTSADKAAEADRGGQYKQFERHHILHLAPGFPSTRGRWGAAVQPVRILSSGTSMARIKDCYSNALFLL